MSDVEYAVWCKRCSADLDNIESEFCNKCLADGAEILEEES